MNKAKRMTRTQRSNLTRKKIIEAGKKLLREDGFENLTVRKICASAGVSNGSFYHFYQSKEGLLAEYLSLEDWVDKYRPEGNLEQAIVDGYMKLVDMYEELGMEFIINFYTPKNQAFNVYTRKERMYASTLYMDMLLEARKKGNIRNDVPVDKIVRDIQTIVIGNIFQWAVMKGNSDVREDIRSMLSNYLRMYAFTEKYMDEMEKEAVI